MALLVGAAAERRSGGDIGGVETDGAVAEVAGRDRGARGASAETDGAVAAGVETDGAVAATAGVESEGAETDGAVAAAVLAAGRGWPVTAWLRDP